MTRDERPILGFHGPKIVEGGGKLRAYGDKPSDHASAAHIARLLYCAVG